MMQCQKVCCAIGTTILKQKSIASWMKMKILGEIIDTPMNNGPEVILLIVKGNLGSGIRRDWSEIRSRRRIGSKETGYRRGQSRASRREETQ